MALLEKLTNLTTTAASKANNAIESGKLNLKINSEESTIREFTANIGELMVDKLDSGLDFDDDEIKALYSSILAARKTIEGYQAIIDANRAADSDDTEDGTLCAKCGAPLAPDAKFCDQCGTKVEEPESAPVEEAAAPVEAPPVCAECGTELRADSKFCTKCGTPVPEKDA